ncbi:MAG: hypothetical protein HGGPFJEG_02300 [Ignavibacteria bacterium]|nr:hypothetical protein [Ignavibacteria bacterium]
MKKLIFVLQLSVFLSSALFAQDYYTDGTKACSQKKMNSLSLPELYNPDSPNSPVHKFDVLDYKIYVDIRSCFLSPYPKSFNGNVIIKFRIDSTLNSINLDAVNSSITVSSVSMSGVSFSHSSNILTINLDRTYSPGEITEVKVNYSHANVSDQAFYAGNGFVFTDCEPEGARKWFPCYDKPSDKATLDLTAKVPSSARLGSNGRLNDSTVTGDTIYYHWISRDPVSTYLIVLTGKVNYKLDIVYWHKISNPTDSIPIRFYYNSGESPNNMKTKVPLMMTYFSQKFGEHAFEKNGFATLNNLFPWGGMENQTLTSLCQNCWSENLISHELAHQWFGDMITCATWADIWMNEAFATYLEAIWYENTLGYNGYKSDILSDASGYFSGNPGWAIYNPQWAVTTPPLNELFNTAITYYKGACVLHMLRYTLGDSMFFNVIKSYATDSAGGFKHNSVATDDFISKASSATGEDLSWFFNEWVKEPNHPVYQNQYIFYNIGGGIWKARFNAKQTQTNSVFHKMPIVLKFSFTTGSDTTIRVMNDINNQKFDFYFNRQPTGIVFDPDNDIVLKQGTTSLNNAAPSQIKAAIQGYYNEMTDMHNMNDSVKVILRSNVSPYSVSDSGIVILDSASLTATLTFEDALSGNYYLVIRHRNSIETWSRNGGEIYTKGVAFSYDFTTSADKAFGNNMILKDGRYCLYNGDINQDGTIEGGDVSEIDNDASEFLLGNFVTDITGDGMVDGSDLLIAGNNSAEFITTIRP